MLALLVVELIIKKTRLGLAIRSASYSLEATSLMGVDTFKLILSIFLIAGSLAGVAGTLLGAKYTAYPPWEPFTPIKPLSVPCLAPWQPSGGRWWAR